MFWLDLCNFWKFISQPFHLPKKTSLRVTKKPNFWWQCEINTQYHVFKAVNPFIFFDSGILSRVVPKEIKMYAKTAKKMLTIAQKNNKKN